MSAKRLVKSVSQIGSTSTRFRTMVVEGSTWNCLRRHKTTQPSGDGFEDLDKPIKFTTSKAAAWKAVSTHGGFVDEDMPWFQPYVVSFSTAIFLLYFLALREENDIDEQMKTPLWEKIPGLEKQQLEVVLQYNKDHGLPTKDVENRLMQIDKDEKAALQKSKAM